MRRDPDIIRAIVFAVEDLPLGERLSALDGISPESFLAHVEWMSDAGLIEARMVKHLSGAGAASVLRLTWAGCDFADAARSQPLWDKAKKSVIGPTMSWTFDILKEWLKAEIKNGLPSLRGVAN